MKAPLRTEQFSTSWDRLARRPQMIFPCTELLFADQSCTCLFVQSCCLMATPVSYTDTKKCSRSGSKGTKVQRVGPVPRSDGLIARPWCFPKTQKSGRTRWTRTIQTLGTTSSEKALGAVLLFSRRACAAPRSALVFGFWRHWKRWSGKTTSTRGSMRAKMMTPSCKKSARGFKT